MLINKLCILETAGGLGCDNKTREPRDRKEDEPKDQVNRSLVHRRDRDED